MKYFFLSLALCSVLACGNDTKNNPATNGSDTTNNAAAATGGATDAKTTEAMLAGKWQSVEDAKSVMEIGGKSIIDFYDGKKMDTRTFVFSADCASEDCKEGKSPKGCFSSRGQFDAACYSVVNVTGSDLEVSLAGGTGKSNHYKKMK